jgi:hypothetical protein
VAYAFLNRRLGAPEGDPLVSGLVTAMPPGLQQKTGLPAMVRKCLANGRVDSQSRASTLRPEQAPSWPLPIPCSCCAGHIHVGVVVVR